MHAWSSVRHLADGLRHVWSVDGVHHARSSQKQTESGGARHNLLAEHVLMVL